MDELNVKLVHALHDLDTLEGKVRRTVQETTDDLEVVLKALGRNPPKIEISKERIEVVIGRLRELSRTAG